MASPFSVFRKHQRVMMAVLGVAAMIAFVFLGPLQQLLRLGSSQDPVIATTVYGKIRYSDMARMRANRNLANRFVAESVRMAGGRQEREAFGEPKERSLVESMLLANKAGQSGVVISDKFITEWLERNLAGRLTAQQYESITRQLNASRVQVYDALRTELMALEMGKLLAGGVFQTTPAQRWEYFQRLRRQATIEALAVNVSDFIGEIATPSDEVIASFYAEFKNAEPVPGSPMPGFKVPQKAKVQYFVAEHDKFADAKSVKDEEIKEHYEKNKDNDYLFHQWPRYAPREKPLEPPLAKPDDAPPAEKPDSSAKPEDKKPDDKKPDDKKTDGKKTDGKSSAAPGPKSDAPAPSSPPKSAPGKAANPAPDSPKAEPPKSAPPKGSGGILRPKHDAVAMLFPEIAASVPRHVPYIAPGLATASAAFEAVLLVNQLAAQDKAADKTSTTDATKAAKSSTEKSEAAKSPTPPGTDNKKSTEKSATEKSPGEKAAGEESAEKSSTEALSATRPAGPATALPTVEPPDAFLPRSTLPTVPDDLVLPREITDFPTYLPLSYVAEAIREEVAKQRAAEKIIAALDEVSAKMKRYGDERRRWEVRREHSPNVTPPQPLDLQALAQEHKLSLHETGMMTPYEAHLLPGIGQSRALNANGLGPEFAQVLFGTLQRHQPMQTFDPTFDLSGNIYLFWKTDSSDAHVPELATIRDEVVRVWKMIEARGRAMKRAESLAEEAHKDNRPLKSIFGGRAGLQVIETAPFSWLTEGPVRSLTERPAPTLSEVKGIVDPGNDFMRVVFDLHVGDVGTAFNNPQTIAYVIRPSMFEPSTTVLETRFLSEQWPQYGAAAVGDREQMILALNETLRREAKLDWVRPPDPAREEE